MVYRSNLIILNPYQYPVSGKYIFSWHIITNKSTATRYINAEICYRALYVYILSTHTG